MRSPRFEDLLEHVGHRIACVVVGSDASVECVDCGEPIVEASADGPRERIDA